MLHVKKDIPRNLFTAKNALLEGFSVELNLRNSKWSQSSQKHDRKACGWSKCYYLDLILGDSNASIEKNQMKCFCDTYGLKN